MLLVNGDNLKRVEISSKGLLKYTDKSRPAEYMCVQPPMKVKVDKDILFVIDVVDNDNGSEPYKLSISPLKSTSRKFQSDYLKEVFFNKFEFRSDYQLITQQVSNSIRKRVLWCKEKWSPEEKDT